MSTSPTAEAQTPVPPIPNEGEACPHCGSLTPWSGASWCPDCGYYPALGGTSLKSFEDVDADAEDDRAAWESLHEGPSNLWEAIPPWAWTTLAGVILVFLANLGVRIILPLKPAQRTLLTLMEFSVGFLVASIAHGSAYLFAACRTDKYGPFDFFMKPVEIWKPTFHRLPEGSRRVSLMAWGSTAVFAALFLVGGFEFNAMFEDWGFDKHEGPNVVKEVVKKARQKKADEEEDMEKAIQEFVGESPEDDADAQLLETRCVIVGYTLTDQGDLSSVILASAPRGRLAYVGVLSQSDIPEENRAEVLSALKTVSQRQTCYLQAGVPFKKAIWVAPQLLCLVQHKSWTSRYSLEKPSFLKLVSAEEEAEEKQKAEEAKRKKQAQLDEQAK